MNTQSIKELRRNFIIIAMLSFMTVMLFTGGLINIANHLRITRNVGNMLDYIIENEGELPDPAEYSSEGSTSVLNNPPLLFTSTQEFMYTTRYYAVIFDRDRHVEKIGLSHIHSVRRKDALKNAEKILDHHNSFGSFDDRYFYKTGSLDHDRTIVVVLDASTIISLNNSIFKSTIQICVAGLFITLLAVLALSGRMIRPEIENARRQKMFITNASHELKTPLAVIRANTELEELMNGETEWTQSTLRQVVRLNGLIQNLVLIARAQEAEEPGIRKDFDASSAIRETAEPYEALSLKQGKDLTLEIVPDIHMNADESKIRQLAVILIDNAFKYCDEEGSILVTFSKTRIGRQVRLTVSNSYAKGKEVDYSQFFDRFYREDSSRSTNKEKDGFGIGLSIAESICTQYKGNIRAAWKDGTITFTCLLGI